MTKQEYNLHQGVKIWNVLYSVLFLVLNVFMYFVYTLYRGGEPVNVDLIDILILILSNFRIIRLFVYDNLTLFFRELFMDLKMEDGKYFFVQSKYPFKLTLHKLSTCPWCLGVWSTFISAFLYFTFPVFKIVFILFAISAVSSFLILLTNLIGWYAEGKKKYVENL